MSFATDMKITVRSPAKINLYLEVIGKRKDNFHELAMIMQSIDLYDFLEIKSNEDNTLNLNSECKELELNEENLIIKAALLLRKFSGNPKLGANIFLKKNIPIGAGLAGGSSNAAATLFGLNKIWQLNLDNKSLHKLAAELGSDVPFCLNGGFQFCFGRGEILEKNNLNTNYGLILIKNPNVSISTADIYKKYSLKFCNDNLLDINYIDKRRDLLRLNGMNNLKNYNNITIRNDLQKIVIKENESVRKGLSLLSQFKNSLCTSMSGSGPSCFAIFNNIEEAKICFKNNKKNIKENGYDAWVCKFIKEGISII